MHIRYIAYRYSGHYSMLRKRCFSFFFLICMMPLAKGQDNRIDSLLKELGRSKEDTGKVNLLRNIGNTYANQDPRKAIEYWKQGVALSYKLNFVKGLARNYINIGTGYSYLSKLDSTIIYADSGIKYSKIIGDPDRLALVYLNKAMDIAISGILNRSCFTATLRACMLPKLAIPTGRQEYMISSLVFI